jgi:pimeloyl-ACP methyl ester carboxylesterase
MRQSRTGFLLAVVISAIMISGQQVASGGSAPVDILYAQPGQLVSVNGFRLNLYCMGSGSPTVVFDSGWEDWAPAWSKVQPEVAKWTRACSYDRAGTGFSDPGPMPRTSVHIAEELRTALHHGGIGGPYILVGHAFGGDNVRTFANLYMGEVAGLVLVDADPNDVEPKSMREEQHRGTVGILSQLRDCRNAIAEHKPLPVLTSRPGQPQRTCAQQFFRGLPEAAWSPELNAKLLESRKPTFPCMTLIYRKWNKQRRTKPICNSTAAHSARAPSASSPRETTVSATWRGSLRTRRSTSNMSRRPRWPRPAGSHCLRTLNGPSPAIVRNISSSTSRRP